jgi:hypothetical protein
MGETRDHLEAHGGPGMVLCGRTGVFVAGTALCHDCSRRLCETAHGGGACDECIGECPDWEPDQDDN